MRILALIFLVLLIVTAVVIIINDTGDSGRKAAWLLVISILPIVGVVLYFCFGFNNRSRRLFNQRHKRTIEIFNHGTTDEINHLLFSDEADKALRPSYRPLARLLRSCYGPAVSTGNSLELITRGQRKFELLVKDISEAKEYIHLEYFRFGNDQSSRVIRDLLIRKVQEGVKVRFVHENVANYAVPSKYYNDMAKAGVDLVRFTNPRFHLVRFITRLNYRNHRKIVVIDGRIAYTGGMNINDHYFLQWRDTHLRIEGEAVASLQYIFLDSWITAGGTLDRPLADYFPLRPAQAGTVPIQVSPDEPDSNWPVLQMAYIWAIQHAKQYIWMQTPYFVPPEPLLDALKSAALTGTDVRIMLPKVSDTPLMGSANRSYLRECLDAGIRIFERQEPFIHSKTFVCDDYLSCIGSTNLDYRSFQLNYENSCFIYDEEVALQNKQIFLEDLALSEELSIEKWDAIPAIHRFWFKIVRLFGPML